MLSWIALTATQDALDEQTKEVSDFFSSDNLQQIFDSICSGSVTLVGKLIACIIIWVVGRLVIKIATRIFTNMLSKTSLDRGIVTFAKSITRVVLYAIMIMMIVDKLGFQTTSLLTLFGSGALAVGLSLQGSLSNFAGGVLILIFKPFKVGDYIITGEMEGTVKTIEILYTRLLTLDGKVVMIPNGTLANSSITNIGSQPSRRLEIPIAISYSGDIKKARELLKDVYSKDSRVLQDRENAVIVKSLDESCVTLEARTWVKNEDYWDARFDLIEAYKEAFDANGVEIPFNQLDIHVIQNNNNIDMSSADKSNADKSSADKSNADKSNADKSNADKSNADKSSAE